MFCCRLNTALLFKKAMLIGAAAESVMTEYKVMVAVVCNVTWLVMATVAVGKRMMLDDNNCTVVEVAMGKATVMVAAGSVCSGVWAGRVMRA